jgi:capsular exopolysaccharide synthesis family protein
VQNPISSPNQVERRFAHSRFGSIPRWRARRNRPTQLVVDNASGTAVVEAIRQTAANIAFAANEQGIKSLALVSPDSGDARTSLVVNMGVVMATGWEDVVLVNADLRRPSLHRYFNLPNARGLSTLMTDPNVEIADVIQETPYPRRKVITSCPVLENQIEVLRCPRMTWLLNQLINSRSTVLVGTAPVPASADAAIIDSQVQGVIVVANESRNTVDGLESALDALHRANANILGFVWNRAIAGPFDFFSKKQRY